MWEKYEHGGNDAEGAHRPEGADAKVQSHNMLQPVLLPLLLLVLQQQLLQANVTYVAMWSATLASSAANSYCLCHCWCAVLQQKYSINAKGTAIQACALIESSRRIQLSS